MNREELLRAFKTEVQIRSGDCIIIHSSLKSIGWVEGGADAVVDALQSAVGLDGTLLMPAYSAPPADGSVELSRLPSRVGRISEAFRSRDGVLRSFHPTHSVCAWGRRAEALIADHERTSGLGDGSPFHKAARNGAYVLLIGCDFTSCSLVHVAEAIARVPYLGRVTYPGYARPLAAVAMDGRRRVFSPHDVPGDSQGFDVVREELERKGRLSVCRLGAARVFKADGTDILESALALLRRDPAALLCHTADCPVCPSARGFVGTSRTREGEIAQSI